MLDAGDTNARDRIRDRNRNRLSAG
jgi:hypothetical protein